MARPDTGQDESRYVPVAEAAALLGIKPDSVRKAIRRHQLQAIKPTGSSEWLVLIDGTVAAPSRRAPDGTQDATATRPRSVAHEALDELRAQLAAKDRQIAELHVIVARLSQHGTGTPLVLPAGDLAEDAGPGRDDDRDTAPDEGRDGTKRPWWRRLLEWTP